MKENSSPLGSFDGEIQTATGAALHCQGLDTFQINLGPRCNQACLHCHVGASPSRTEVMTWETMEQVLSVLDGLQRPFVDLTGGAPELNPHFRPFVEALHSQGHTVQVRTNLTVLEEPGLESLPAFFREHNVHLVASMPCYLQENVCAQRGEGVYESSLETLRSLNRLGYGRDADVPLNLVYNPGGPFLPPGQAALETDYRRELKERFGIEFTRLLTITNMPIGRFREVLTRDGQVADYERLLRDAFNPSTIEQLMCRHQVSVSWDGTLYDCDFNLALGLPVNHGVPTHLRDFDARQVQDRQIVTGEHCYGCTAGAGSSCKGALV